MAGGRGCCPVIAVVIAAVFIAGGCGSSAVKATTTTTRPFPATKAAPTRGSVIVVLFGDSLAQQAAPDFDRIMETKGATVSNHVFGGTAVCDWLVSMGQAAATRPQAAVLEFSGNTFTPCMNGYPPESSLAVKKYRTDMMAAIHLFLTVGTHVFLEGTPISHAQWTSHDRHWNDLNRAFAALATNGQHGVTYVDAGQAVEGRGESFAWTLPCLSFEPCNGPIVAGVRTDIVRSPDGVHVARHEHGTTLS